MTILPTNSSLRDSIDLIKRTVAKGCTDLELELFVRQCERTGLDPFARQIYAIKRWDATVGAEVMQTQVSIDGFRTLAAETRELGGQDGPYWCGPDGIWNDVWLGNNPPRAARVTVHRIVADGNWTQRASFTGIALYDSYCQVKKDGTPTRMWKQMAPEMLAKCAESLALRKAFPQKLSGLYTTDEMGQSYNPPERVESLETAVERPESASKPVRPSSPILEPPKPLDGDLGASDDSPETHVRRKVHEAIQALSPGGRSEALALADRERLPLPDETSFEVEHANRWLEICREFRGHA